MAARSRARRPSRRAGHGHERIALLSALLAVACAGSRSSVPQRPLSDEGLQDCKTVRDETLRACVIGFSARAREVGEGDYLERVTHAVCPYAGAIAWSGCHRGAFGRFAARSAEGACGDRADFIKGSIETSCLHWTGPSLERFNDFVKECFDWAERGGEDYRRGCESRRL